MPQSKPKRDRQKEYRRRTAARAVRMELALRRIEHLVADRTGPVATEVREIATEALKRDGP